jgi:hypothetical protein
MKTIAKCIILLFCVLSLNTSIAQTYKTLPDSNAVWIISVEEHENHSIKIYPNPVSDYFHIETQLPEEPSLMAITDITGRVVYQSTFSNRIDVSHLPDGIYLIIISCKEGAHYHHKIIKQK